MTDTYGLQYAPHTQEYRALDDITTPGLHNLQDRLQNRLTDSFDTDDDELAHQAHIETIHTILMRRAAKTSNTIEAVSLVVASFVVGLFAGAVFIG